MITPDKKYQLHSMSDPTLETCDNEPIHIPGSIQNHGFLIALDQQLVVRYCSENITLFANISASSALGLALGEIDALKNGTAQDLEAIIRFTSQRDLPTGQNGFAYQLNQHSFNVIVHLHNDYYIVDFEPAQSNLAHDIQSLVGRSLSEILSDKKIDTLLDNVANQIKKIIGYDRVMVYKFHEDGHGEVVAEAKSDVLESWLGLHYPATDIPKQARELYKINLVRLIADVNSVPSAILTHAVAGSAIPLDLTHSTLRAVSPMHIQYLKNMGVASSFSVSILDRDSLWGLIACHNYTPKFINFRERESAKLVGQVLSSAISFREQEEDQQHATEHRQAIETITRYLLRNTQVQDALINQEATIKDVLKCGGAALYFENKLDVTGNVPDNAFIHKLVDWLGDKTYEDGYYMTNKLIDDFPLAGKYKFTVSGLLACRLGKDLKEYMLWFRPEQKSLVKWAGNPDKIAQKDETGIMHISPRNSFEAWAQTVELSAVSWKKHELEAAMALRDEVNYAISRKANELRVVNEKLRVAYEELDTFSYTISHDLKNPLATIKSYSQLIKRGDRSIDQIKMMAERIEAGTQKMQLMIDEVLAYSKVGQTQIQKHEIDMRKLLEDLRDDLLVASDRSDLIIEIKETPEIIGDQLMVLQVFSNVVGNAVKYSSKADRPKVTIAGTKGDTEIVYAISDNGIGIAKAEHETIFELFSRASAGKGFEGTGVGLSIVKRILEKHDGNIWLDSTVGSGSVFFVSFKRYDIPTVVI
ncbi:MAG: GAF domain-containing protein [Flavobacteriales bacterium]|nr:MAG: GAF domain-containing protein [Flavobacteriales bacterium]